MKWSPATARARAARSFGNLPGVDQDHARISEDNPIAGMVYIAETELDLIEAGEVQYPAADVRAIRRFVATYRPYADEAAKRLTVKD